MRGVCSFAVATIFPPDMVAGYNYHWGQRDWEKLLTCKCHPVPGWPKQSFMTLHDLLEPSRTFQNLPGPSRTVLILNRVVAEMPEQSGCVEHLVAPVALPLTSPGCHRARRCPVLGRQGWQGWGEEGGSSAACSHLPALATAISCTRSKPN